MPALLAVLLAALAGTAMQVMGESLYQQPSLYRSAVLLMLVTYSLFFSAWPIYVSFPIVLVSTPLPMLLSISGTVLRHSTRVCLPMLSMTRASARAIASVVCRTVTVTREIARCRERQHAQAQADKAAAELLRQDQADTVTRATNHRKQRSSKDRRDQGRSSRRTGRTSPSPALPIEPLNDSAEYSPVGSSCPITAPSDFSLDGETTCIVCVSDENKSHLGVPCGHVQKEEEDEEEDGTCILCLDAERTHAAVPCGHRSFCDGCAQRAREHELPCPICRKSVQMWMRVWG